MVVLIEIAPLPLLSSGTLTLDVAGLLALVAGLPSAAPRTVAVIADILAGTEVLEAVIVPSHAQL